MSNAPRPRSELLLPPASLAGVIFAAIYRDTRGAGLTGRDRYNHFPASPLISVTVLRSGALFLVVQVDHIQVPEIAVMGPQDLPVTSWSPGEIEALSIGVYPDAWRALGGDETTVPEVLLPALQALRDGRDITTDWAAFLAALAGQVEGTRGRFHGVSDWVRGVTARAALSSKGQSLRSFERRLKRLSGQTQSRLAFYSQFEELHRVSRRGQAPLSQIALDAGYADQSHMGRAVRRATGLSPARLNEAIASEEAFWCYRLLGERF